MRFIKCILAILVLFLSLPSFSQKEGNKSILKDTLDGKLDFSRFIIDANGFLPVAMIITEPALGNFGMALAPIFLSPKESPDGSYVPPDMTIGMGMYTANNSWMLGAMRIGTLPKQGIKYRVGVGYGAINLSFYRTILNKEREFAFNITTLPAFASLSKKIHKKGIYVGINYLYLNSNASPNFKEEVPDFISSKELKNHTSTLGAFLELDKRNSVFTPDKGYIINIHYGIDDTWTGSDFTFSKLTNTINVFLQPHRKWVCGFRSEFQQVYKSPPFYMLPGINMRGIPAARYQGASTILLETEQRYDFTLRWSGVFFIGTGKAITKNQSFSDANYVYSTGAGFRYLLARAFKIRAGVDLAYSEDGLAYYIVFGHNWNR